MQTLKEVHPFPDLHKSCSLQNFIEVELYVSWQLPKFNSIQFFFISHAGRITKVYLKMYYKKFKTTASTKDNIT